MFSKYFVTAVLCLSLFSVGAVAQQDDGASGLTTDKEKMSYGIGVQFGKALVFSQDRIDFDALVRGLSDSASGKDLVMSESEMRVSLMEFQKTMKKDREEGMASVGKVFLDEKAQEEGVVELDSGLLYKVIRPGTGASPKATDTVETHYRGTFADGTEFDSSYGRGEPAQFPVNRVIAGWTEALQLMKEGAKWELYIPYDLAYGSAGREGIPGYSTLVFEIEMLRIVK